MTTLLPFSQPVSIATIQSFLKRYITLFWVNWLRNSKSLKGWQIYMEDPVGNCYLVVIFCTKSYLNYSAVGFHPDFGVVSSTKVHLPHYL